MQIPSFTGPPVRVGKKIDTSERTGCAELVVASSYQWSPRFIDGRNVGTTLLHRLTLMLYAERDPSVAERRLVSLEDARRRGVAR